MPRAVARASCCFCGRVRWSITFRGSSLKGSPLLSISSDGRNTTPKSVGPAVFGFSCASKSSCNWAYTSGSRFPRTGYVPLRSLPTVNERPCDASAADGADPSGSRYIATSCANCFKSSGVAGGAASGPGPSTSSGTRGAASASALSASARTYPRAWCASSASARSRSVSPIRTPARSIGPVAASNPAIPIVPSRIASRNAGHRAGSGAPDVSSTS